MNLKRTLITVTAIATAATVSCSRGRQEDPHGLLAEIAGRMAAENDLKEVRFADLNNDGSREVIMVFGPRELLDFDVYYSDGDGDWRLTPMVNDKNNPREFVSTRLDSIFDADGDGVPEITVSSRLYDGNTMVKELHWSPEGYEVVGQRTVMTESERQQAAATPQRSAARTAAPSARPVQSSTAPAQSQASAPQQQTATAEAQPEPEPEPGPEPIPPVRPRVGTYIVKKGDTVYGLARALGVSADDLEGLNNNRLARRGLRIGQRIWVPVPRSNTEQVQVRIEKRAYVVQGGDSLSSIAERFNTTVRALRSWNHDIPEDGTIKVGEKLVIHQAMVDIDA